MTAELPDALKSGTNYPESYLATNERDGERWAAISDTALTGIVGHHGADLVRDACSTEMQRRMAVSVRASIAVQERLIAAIEASGDCAAQQTEQVISLTNTLKVLTVVLVVLGFVQIIATFWKG